MSVLSYAGEYMGIAWSVMRSFDLTWRALVYLGYGDLPGSYLDCFPKKAIVYRSSDEAFAIQVNHRDYDVKYNDSQYVIDVAKNTINAFIRVADESAPQKALSNINRFLIWRNAARRGTIAVIGALRSPAFGAGTGDVAKIIARVVWSTRVFYK